VSEQPTSRGAFLVLLALHDGPKHGYEVAAFIKERSEGHFSLSFGALYPVLHKLEAEKLIAGNWREAGEAKKKKVYTLTGAGKKALSGERDRYEASTLAFAKLLASK